MRELTVRPDALDEVIDIPLDLCAFKDRTMGHLKVIRIARMVATGQTHSFIRVAIPIPSSFRKFYDSLAWVRMFGGLGRCFEKTRHAIGLSGPGRTKEGRG